MTHRADTSFILQRIVRSTLGLSMAGCLLWATVADAQINRSRPPSGGGSSGGSSSGSSGGSRTSGSGGGSSRSDSGSSSGGGGTRTPSESRGSRGGGGSSDSGSSGGNLGGVFNRSRPNTGSSDGVRSGGGRVYGNSGGPMFGTGGGLRSRGDNSGTAAGRLSPFSYNPNIRSRASFPSSYERFTQSREGQTYRYNNGAFGRSNLFVYNGGWGSRYFANNCAYYPYYRPAFVSGVTCYSPFVYYGNWLPSFITLGNVYYAPPPAVYVPYPVYTETGQWRGYRRDDTDDYYLNRERDEDASRIRRNDRELDAAINDISDAWRYRDIQMLARHTAPDAPIAVYLRGKYQYSLSSVDYLDMTRDAFRVSQTVRFRLDRIQRKDRGVYLVSGRHTYRDKDDQERNVYVSYVLERSDEGYLITQVGTAPERIDEED
jgi:hypothetical protein